MDNITKKTFHFQFHLSHTSYIFFPVPVLLCNATCFNPLRGSTPHLNIAKDLMNFARSSVTYILQRNSLI